MVTLYNVVSQDWFIAREDGSEDFIPNELWPITLAVYEKLGTLVMGRKTYETIQSYEKTLREPFENLAIRKIVISHDKNLNTVSGYEIEDTPEKALAMTQNVLVSSGPTLNDYLFEKKLVNQVLLHQIPTAIDDGIPAFDPRYRAVLSLESESDFDLFRELCYRVI